MHEHWRGRVLHLRVANAQLAAVVSSKSENLVSSCEECSMVITTGQLLDNDIERERVGHVVGHLLHLFLSFGLVFLSQS